MSQDTASTKPTKEELAKWQGAEERLLAIEDAKVLLDTNILIFLSGEKEKMEPQRKLIMRFCSRNKPYLTDTVYYEFLRNCNITTYRNRRLAIEKVLTNKKKHILHEGKNVQDEFARLYFLYLFAYKDQSSDLPFRTIEDMWIIASAIQGKMDTILTQEDSADFCKSLFRDEKFDIGQGIVLHLKTFDKKVARSYIKEMRQSKAIPVMLSNIETMWPSRKRRKA